MSAIDRAKVEVEIENHSQKNIISKFITHHSCVCILSILGIIILSVFLSALVLEMDEFGSRQYYVWSDLRVKRVDALNEAIEDVREKELGDKEMPLQVEVQQKWHLYILYHATKGSTVLTVDNLAIFNQVEDIFAANKDYHKVCLAKSSADRSCEPAKTFTPWFDGVTTNEEVTQIMQKKADDNFDSNKIFFDKTYTPTTPRAKWARSYYRFGLPIQDGDKRYRSSTDDFESQQQFY